MIDNSWKRTTGLAICLFGQMEIWYNGQQITETFTSFARQLLALLILNRDKPQLRRDLATKLWPDDIDADPILRRDKFRQQLRRLRMALTAESDRILEPAGLGSEALAFNLSGVVVDVFLFEEAIQQSRFDPRQRRLEESIHFYRDDLLTEIDSDWITKPRRNLKQKYLKVLLRLAAEAENDGVWERAEEWLRQALQADGLNEDVVCQLLSFLARHGQPHQIDLVYQDLVDAIVADDPEKRPNIKTQQLYRNLQTELRAASQIGTVSDSQHNYASSPFYVPAPLRSLVGQETFCRELLPLLRISRIVTLIGPGGIGKTRIALEIAPRLVSEFRDGVAFVDLSLVRVGASHSDLVQIIAQSLHVPNILDRHPDTGLHTYLANKSLLLIVDNCEHIISTIIETLTELLSQHRHLRVLATSREPLRISGELVRQIPPLSYQSSEANWTPALLQRSEAGRLFLQRVSLPSFVLTADTAADIGWICRTLEGIPLAIEIASATLDEYESTHALTESMRRSLWFLRGLEPTGPGRSQNLEATIRWSYDLLTTTEQEFLQNISVLVGGGGLDTIKAVSERDDALTFVRNLETRSLLVSSVPPGQTADLSSQRFRIPEPVRQFATDRLTEAGKDIAALQRHADYFARLMKQSEPGLRGPNQTALLHMLEGEQGNMNAALQWSLRDDATIAEKILGLQLVGHIWRFWMIRGGQASGKVWIEKSLTCYQIAPPEVGIKVLQGAGNMALFQKDFDHAQSCFMKSGELARQINDWSAEAAALGGQASVARGQKNLEQAKKLLLECLSIFRDQSDSEREAIVLGNLANVASDQEQYQEAIDYHRDTGELFRQRKDTHGLILSLNNLAYTYLQVGDINEMSKTLQEVFSRSRETDNRRGLVHGLTLALSLLQRCERHEECAVFMGIHEAFRERFQLPLAPDLAKQYQADKKLSHQKLGTTLFDAAFQRGFAFTENESIDYIYRIQSQPM